MLTRTIKIQLAIFSMVAVVAVIIVGLGYMRLPSMLFGVGQYAVRMELAQSGGLYARGNVTYRGTEVGRVTSVHLTATGVEADLALRSDIPIPSDLDAAVHSQTAIGEQYVALLPRNGTSPPLKDGDVIPRSRTSVPPNIGELLDAVNRGVQAIPHDNLKTVIDESYTALAGLGPEFSRLVKGGTSLAIGAHNNLDALTALIDKSKPVMDSQNDTAGAVRAWAAHLATITNQLRTQDAALAGVLETGPPAADKMRAQLDRLKPTLPILLANLVTVGQVALTYRNNIEQLLVVVPQGVAIEQAAMVPNLHTKQAYRGIYDSFNLNVNLPPPCTTGFLPVQQQRSPTFEDAPERPAGDLYCRVPQDAMWDVRGARNLPCETRPGKRAPTVKMCESDEQYVPLNDGYTWKGDPNATISGQDIPQLPSDKPPTRGAPPAPPPVPAIAASEYDPATGTYVGPDGNIYTQSDLAHDAPKEKTWQSMLTPPPQ